MSWYIDNQTGDLVLEGVENGIADSPHAGIADLRNVDISSLPGDALVNHKMSTFLLPALITARAFTVAEANDTFTYSGSPAVHNGMAIRVSNLVGGTGLTADSVVYYVGAATATTFKLYNNPFLSTVVNVTVDGSGDFTAFPLGKPVHWSEYRSTSSSAQNWLFFIDTNGRAWSVNKEDRTGTGGVVAAGTVQFLGNMTLTGATGQGIVAWAPSGSSTPYLFVFREDKIDYAPFLTILNQTAAPATAWTYGWQTITSDSTTGGHQALVASDDTVYFMNFYGLGSIAQAVGDTFDPTDSASYVYNALALDIPGNDFIRCFAELGTDLLIGGIRNVIYPWDRISPSYRKPLILPEFNTARIVGTNANAYIFAGTKGRIYITNGASVDLFKKIPPHITGYPNPHFIWNDACYANDSLYFSFTAKQTDSTTISDLGGLWSLNLSTGALRYANKPSSDNYTTIVSMIAHNRRGTALQAGTLPMGDGVIIGWDNSSVYGVDQTSATPYSNFEPIITYDLVPIGTFIDKKTPTGFEFKLSKPLVANESIRLSYRTNLNESFTTIDTGDDDNSVSEEFVTTFENAEMLQMRAELSSTASTPSYVPLRQLRIKF